MAHTAGCVWQKPSLSVVHVKYLWISSHNSPLPSSSLPLPSCPLYTPPSLQPFPFPSPLVPSTPLPPPTSSLPLPSCPLPSLSCYDHHCLCNYVHTHIPHPHHHMYVCVYTLMYVLHDCSSISQLPCSARCLPSGLTMLLLTLVRPCG